MLRTSLPATVVVASAIATACAATQVGAQGIESGGTLLVTVVDRRNQPTVNVDAADFVVSQGDESREVLAVRVADYPLVLLLDTAGDLDAIRVAARRFVERVGDRAVAVLTLTDPPTVLASVEDGRAAALARIDGATPAPTTARAPFQALAAAARLIREAGSPFAAIVLVSASPLEDEHMEPPGFLTSFIESRAILHVVTKGASTAPAGSVNEAMLRNLANRSGGRHLMIYSSASFQIALDQLADRLGMEMLVEYLTPVGGVEEGEVRVGVKVPGARVRGLGVAR
jgi:hypothetical protein